MTNVSENTIPVKVIMPPATDEYSEIAAEELSPEFQSGRNLVSNLGSVMASKIAVKAYTKGMHQLGNRLGRLVCDMKEWLYFRTVRYLDSVP